MQRWIAAIARACLVAVVATTAACTPCAPSSDVKVSLVTAGVDGTSVSRLHLLLSIDGQPARGADLTLPRPLGAGGAFLLRPDPAPSGDWDLALTIQAFDDGGTLVGIGSVAGRVAASGCNALEAALTAPGPNVDLSMPDLSTAPDLTGADLGGICGPGAPDEDQDGIGNLCDDCPADPDARQLDSDGDTLGDACDPDPAKAGNVVRLFEPFDVDTGKWAGTRTIAGSQCTVDTQGPGTMTVGDPIDGAPAGLRAQTVFSSPGFYQVTGPANAGLFIGTNADPRAGGATGVTCVLTHAPVGADTVDLFPVTAGSPGPTVSQPAAQRFFSDQTYRMRLTVRGTLVSCEVVGPSGVPTVVNASLSAAPTATQFVALWATSLVARFNYVYVASTLP